MRDNPDLIWMRLRKIPSLRRRASYEERYTHRARHNSILQAAAAPLANPTGHFTQKQALQATGELRVGPGEIASRRRGVTVNRGSRLRRE